MICVPECAGATTRFVGIVEDAIIIEEKAETSIDVASHRLNTYIVLELVILYIMIGLIVIILECALFRRVIARFYFSFIRYLLLFGDTILHDIVKGPVGVASIASLIIIITI